MTFRRFDRVVVTGGAGFLGSHLCERLLDDGSQVVAVDNFCTGDPANVAHLDGHPGFELQVQDVSLGLEVEGAVDAVLHFACPASPPDYLALPLETLAVCSQGTRHALDLARRNDARLLLASTSEVYGDPLVHPQDEEYWGNVNPIGPRSVYDEGKRFAEALTMAYRRAVGVDVAIARIFNTYGPRLRPGDGRVVSNFVSQALAGDDLTVYGPGTQTRSFCYVDDEVDGLLALLRSAAIGPVNIGNPEELTIRGLAELVLELTGSPSRIISEPLPIDDPLQRRPSLERALTELGWRPTVALREGLERTIPWFRTAWQPGH